MSNLEHPYVWWCCGVWKVIELIGTAAKLRWVWGSRPDQGVFWAVSTRELEPLTDMEVIAIVSTEEVVP